MSVDNLQGAQAVVGQAIETNGELAAQIQEALSTFSTAAGGLLAAKVWLDRLQAQMAEDLGPNNETVGGLTAAAEQGDVATTALASTVLELERVVQAVGNLGAELEAFQNALGTLA